MTNSVNLEDIVSFCDKFLANDNYKDYSFNGLQVNGKQKISKIVTGVTANIELFEKAKELNADLVLVHHGLYWKGRDPRLVGVLGNRIKALGENSLVAYHLPLDGHIEIGNNALISKAIEASSYEYLQTKECANVAMIAKLDKSISSSDMKVKLDKFFNNDIKIIFEATKDIKNVAICSGGGGFLLENDLTDIDAVIVGEIHEQHFHLAKELGVTLFVCGHHATEICGIKALGEVVAKQFNLEHEFCNIFSPV